MSVKTKTKSFIYRFLVFFIRLYFKIFYRCRVYGLENWIPGKAIVAANHASYLDPPLLACSMPEEMHFLARSSLFDRPVLRWFINKLNAHPIAMGATNKAAFDLMLKLLKEDKKVLLFPEGTRSEGGELAPLKKGITLLVERAQAPVIPVYIHGTYEAWNRKMKKPKYGVLLTCVIGKAVDLEEFAELPPREAKEAFLLSLQKSFVEMRNWVSSNPRTKTP